MLECYLFFRVIICISLEKFEKKNLKKNENYKKNRKIRKVNWKKAYINPGIGRKPAKAV